MRTPNSVVTSFFEEANPSIFCSKQRVRSDDTIVVMYAGTAKFDRFSVDAKTVFGVLASDAVISPTIYQVWSGAWRVEAGRCKQ